MTGHKTVEASGTGTLTVYQVTSKLVPLMINYVKEEVSYIF
ncbi:phage tail tube protein [Pseudobacillus badius]|nr:phage tail tube protein [Bacillus badius]